MAGLAEAGGVDEKEALELLFPSVPVVFVAVEFERFFNLKPCVTGGGCGGAERGIARLWFREDVFHEEGSGSEDRGAKRTEGGGFVTRDRRCFLRVC